MSDVILRDVLQYLADERNVDLRGYKATSLERRFRHRMFQLKVGSYGHYLEYLRKQGNEVNELLNTVLINVTHFFRDPQAWEALRGEVIPELARRLAPGDPFRAWSAGCASGEEPYSLAILLSDYFGESIEDYDVKVYATDVDEDALNVARRGEYSAEELRHVRPQWREAYFQGRDVCRIGRNIRRLCIFGRGNLVTDAPISHVNLLLCRNVLIYFDSGLQMQTLERLHYALEPQGILMLGKAETQLSQNALFAPVNARWRIFRRTERDTRRGAVMHAFSAAEEGLVARKRQDHSLLKAYHDAILETARPGILVLDDHDRVQTENESVLRLFGLKGQSSAGKRVSESAVAARCPALPSKLSALRESGESVVEFDCTIPDRNETRTLRVILRNIRTPAGGRGGTLVYVDDVTVHQKLQHTVENLEATGEELQSSNEELETTNEELQSTNEELETTNEELQSTNEELETTNEELQALNEELGTTNEELESRTRELDELNARYLETFAKIPWPVMLVDAKQTVQFWNTSIQTLFGLPEKSVVGLEVKQLPLPERVRNLLARRCREAAQRLKELAIHDQAIDTNSFRGQVNVRFTPLGPAGTNGGVLVMFELLRRERLERGSRVGRGRQGGKSGSKNVAAKKKNSRGKQ